MKVLLTLPGKLKTVPMGMFSGKALQALGHEVIYFDYWPQWSDKLHHKLLGKFCDEEQSRINHRFRSEVEGQKPDLVLTIYGFNLSLESLVYLRKIGIPSVCWWLNDPFQFERSLKKAPYFDFLFTNAQGSVASYRKQGVNAYWLPTACDPDVHKVVAESKKYHCDICFAGDWSPLREEWISHLVRHYDGVKIFGPWGKKIAKNSVLRNYLVDGFFSPDKMASMFASAKVILNIHTWYGKWSYGTNPRLFEAAGCGAAQAVDWKDELPDLFDYENELLVYKDLDDLTEKLAGLLKNEDHRAMIGKLSQKRAYSEHTYRKRMEVLLSVIG